MQSQEVVHSAQTEESDVADTSVSTRGPNGHAQECAFDAAGSSGTDAVGSGRDAARRLVALALRVWLGAVRKWVCRDQADARAGLPDRPSRPRRDMTRVRDYGFIDATRHSISISRTLRRREYAAH